MINLKKEFIIYVFIYIALLSFSIPHITYLHFLWNDFDLGFSWTILFILFSQLFYSLFIYITYLIFFSFIFKIKLKNITIYFLVLFWVFISSIFPDLWILNSFLILISNFFTLFSYWYYLKYIKNHKK